MKEKLPLALVCVAVLAFACGPRPHGEGDPDRSTAPRSASADARTPLAPSLDVSVEDGVRFEFHVTNEGARKLELRFNDGQTHEFVVLDTLGREVWRWSEGRLFTQAVQNRVMRSSDSIRFEDAWKEPEPGTYIAVATLASRNHPIEQRARFTVR